MFGHREQIEGPLIEIRIQSQGEETGDGVAAQKPRCASCERLYFNSVRAGVAPQSWQKIKFFWKSDSRGSHTIFSLGSQRANAHVVSLVGCRMASVGTLLWKESKNIHHMI